MANNQVVETIKNVIGKGFRDCLQGNVTFSNGKCDIEERGGVYGIAVDLSGMTKEDRRNFFNSFNENKKLVFDDWKPIGESFYPLYWGCDINLGFRLFAHTKFRKSLRSLQLNKRSELYGKNVIYGAVLCCDRKKKEKELRKKYPDIYHTR